MTYVMDPRKTGKIIVTAVLGIVVVFILVMIILRIPTANEPEESEFTEFEQMLIIKAKNIFEEKKAEGILMDKSPCLTNDLAEGWVLDVAHDPREPIDNLPENQCSSFREGKAKHFIELNPEGKLIKIK